MISKIRIDRLLKFSVSTLAAIALLWTAFACKVRFDESHVLADDAGGASAGYACIDSASGVGYLFKPDGTEEYGYDCAKTKVGLKYACAMKNGFAKGYLFKPDGTNEYGYDCDASKIGSGGYACVLSSSGYGALLFKPDGSYVLDYKCDTAKIPGAQ